MDIIAKLRLPNHRHLPFISGILFTLLLALLGFGLAQLPGLSQIGPLACAILLAVLYRQKFGYPDTLRSGIQFSSKRLLRLAIILYGLKLNLQLLISKGLPLLALDALVILFAIGLTVLLAKWWKADFSLSLLLGIGTGICGAAAIAAVTPILRSKQEDSALSVGIIALTGTLFAVGYVLLRPVLPLADGVYGIWAGLSLHELAHVALAAAPAGQDAVALALLAKLGRVLLLVPSSFLLLFWQRKKAGTSAPIEFPWFLLGFLALSIAGTLFPLPADVLQILSTLTTLLLAMAMVGLGLNVALRDLRAKALRPLLIIAVTSTLLSTLTFWLL
ncbi:putative integral membrane protein (TIGR00698 family) [Tumebacillus sp. BK434]|nr:putative integral membrane protein (TIGR00698 family) [Tumebacillus sp. BK434]